MPFSDEDKIIIKHYRQRYNWGSRKILTELGEDKSRYRIPFKKRSTLLVRMKGLRVVDDLAPSARMKIKKKWKNWYLVKKIPIAANGRGVRVDSDYYCNSLLSQMMPEMNALSPNKDYIFQQDGARSHTSKYTIRYFRYLPEDAQILLPEDWPPHSPDLNPMDYSIWESLANKVFKVKIKSIEHLCERLGEAWEEITQDEVDRVVSSFRRRLKTCIASQGKRFEYKLKSAKKWTSKQINSNQGSSILCVYFLYFYLLNGRNDVKYKNRCSFCFSLILTLCFLIRKIMEAWTYDLFSRIPNVIAIIIPEDQVSISFFQGFTGF